jgi:hypothetical protein
LDIAESVDRVLAFFDSVLHLLVIPVLAPIMMQAKRKSCIECRRIGMRNMLMRRGERRLAF